MRIGLSEKLSLNPRFFFLLKMQKYAFLRKMVLNEVLYQIKVQLVINWSSRLQKHQTFEILIELLK